MLTIKLKLDELTEAGRVVITNGLGIAKRFEKRVRLQHAVDDGLIVTRRNKRCELVAEAKEEAGKEGEGEG